jgi:fused signal recognition particle receptor
MQLLPIIGIAVVVFAFFIFVVHFAKKKKSKAGCCGAALEEREREGHSCVSSEDESEEAQLQAALADTKENLWGRIKGLFEGKAELNESELAEIEEILYTSDMGPATVEKLLSQLKERISKEKNTVKGLRDSLREIIWEVLAEVQADREPILDAPKPEKLKIWMVVGVNGAGKTTTLGKLAYKLMKQGKRVMIAAGDTFRAAADEQLKVWADRAQVEIFSPEGVTSPSAVAFDACKKALSGDYHYLLVDTAGRLHTQKHLMDELKKMRKVIEKNDPEAPHEVILVIDANSGQNALIQAKEFNDALGLTGVIITKLDGSAKGGVALGVAGELEIPIDFIGIGEGVEHLKPFDPKSFLDSII